MAGAGGDEWIYVPSKQEDAEAEQEQAVTTGAATPVGQENSKPSKNPDNDDDEDHRRCEEEEEEEEEFGFTPEELETLEKAMEQLEMDKAVEALDRATERIVRGTHLEQLESEVQKTYNAWTAAELDWALASHRLKVARRADQLEYDRAFRAYQALWERHRTPNDVDVVDGGAVDAASSDTGGGGPPPAADPRDARVMDDLLIGPNSSAPASPALFSSDYDNRYGGFGFGPGVYRSPGTGLGGYYAYGSGFGFPVAYRNPATATGLGNGFPAGGPVTGSYYGGYIDPYLQALAYKTVTYQAPPPALFASSSTLAPAPAPLQPRPYVYTPPAAPPASDVPSSSLGVAAPTTTQPLEPISFGNFSFS